MIHASPPAGWLPTSSCSSACLPPPQADGSGRLARRLTALLAVLAAAALTTPVLPLVSVRQRARWLGGVARAALATSGIRLVVDGEPRFGDGGLLVVANHQSWVEVVALVAVQPIRMLAKREVRRWPLLGLVAAATETLFVDRTRLHSLPTTIAEVAVALKTGDVVGVFPEGTTWCGAVAGRFHRAPFQAALDAGVPVRPVAITLRTSSGSPARCASFVGDVSLLQSLCRVLRLPELECRLTILPTIRSEGDRAGLAGAAADAISRVTHIPHVPDRQAKEYGRPTMSGTIAGRR